MLAPFSAFASRDATSVNPPDAPTALEVAQASTNQAQLRWVHGSGSDTFEIDRSADGGAYSQIDTAAAGARTYADAGPLTDGVLYAYRVRSTNLTNGDSENSDSASVTIDTAETFPTAGPESLAVTVTSGVDDQGEVTLTWTDESSNETGFRVYQGGVLVASPAAGVVTAQITGLADETQYSFKVCAVTGSNLSIPTATKAKYTRLAEVSDASSNPIKSYLLVEWTNNSSRYQNIKVLDESTVIDTLAKGTNQYYAAVGQSISLRAVASGIPSSTDVAAAAGA